MDANFLRSLVAVLSLVAFLGIVWWAWGRGRRGRFDDAANLPFADDDMQQRTLLRERRDEHSRDEHSQDEENGRG